ncbi:predicted protein [Naegleria gruberi]|uniref:Predicted protein n=1 Tax=Naegleria gruberi TaxID=5762 RepID=D2V2U3_NAEGR|nr:uncharacterized protein NAEGRDRAFT_46249 [Naegleria gruberi]EFC49120.1 predicted protein [Naegleria gruberi]|eukprot:XP_002681864.1 predicted protein [Naegleria gruberi strain NEG-M]
MNHQQIASLPHGKEQSFGRIVENIVRQINDHVIDCFGPKSSGKIITIIGRDNNTQQYLSNEGGFIIQNLNVKHPVGLMIVKLVKQIQMGCGDGTINVVCLLNELLKVAQDLINNDTIETNLVCETFTQICKKCVDEMKKFALNILVDENGNSLDLSSIKSNKDILNVKIHIDKRKSDDLVRTFFRTKLNDEKIISQLVNICLKASFDLYDGLSIKQMKNIQLLPNFHNVNIISQVSLSSRVEYIDGLVFEHGLQNQFMPRYLKDCKVIAISDIPLEMLKEKKKNEFKSAQERLELLRKEREIIDYKLKKILKFSPSFVISNNAIDDSSLNQFSRHNTIALRHVRQDIFDRICEMTSATKIYDCDYIKEDYIGHAEFVSIKEDQRHAQPESIIHIKGNKYTVGSIIVSASNRVLNQQYSRLIRGALKIIRNSYEDCLIAPGGGSLEMMLSSHLKKTANKLSPIEQLIYEKFSLALESSVPFLICESSGLNTSTTLRTWMHQIKKEKILTLETSSFPARFIHPEVKGVWDSMRVKIQCLHQAVEMVCTLLKIDSMHTATDLKKEFNDSMQKTLNELAQQEVPLNNEWKQSNQPFTKLPSHLSSTQQERRKQQIIKKDKAFYSKEKSKQRKKLDHIQSDNAQSIQQHQNSEVEREHERKLREKGLVGYDIDPFH